jgi:hypothetical protein
VVAFGKAAFRRSKVMRGGGDPNLLCVGTHGSHFRIREFSDKMISYELNLISLSHIGAYDGYFREDLCGFRYVGGKLL